MAAQGAFRSSELGGKAVSLAALVGRFRVSRDPARLCLLQCFRAPTWGLRRAQRQAASKRPAAKLGGGGGWNLKDRDPADLTRPRTPGRQRAHRDRGKCRNATSRNRVRRTKRSEARMTSSSARARRSARSAATDGAPPLPGSTRVVSRRAAANRMLDGAEGAGGQSPHGRRPGDASRDSRDGVRGRRPGRRRGRAAGDARRRVRPRAPEVAARQEAPAPRLRGAGAATRAAAVAAAKALHATELHTPSRATDGIVRAVKASADVGPAMDAAFLNGEQGEDAPLVTEDGAPGGASRLKILEPSAPGKGDPFHDPEIHDPDHPAYDASPPFAMRELGAVPHAPQLLGDARHGGRPGRANDTPAILPVPARRRARRSRPELAAAVPSPCSRPAGRRKPCAMEPCNERRSNARARVFSPSEDEATRAVCV